MTAHRRNFRFLSNNKFSSYSQILNSYKNVPFFFQSVFPASPLRFVTTVFHTPYRSCQQPHDRAENSAVESCNLLGVCSSKVPLTKLSWLSLPYSRPAVAKYCWKKRKRKRSTAIFLFLRPQNVYFEATSSTLQLPKQEAVCSGKNNFPEREKLHLILQL